MADDKTDWHQHHPLVDRCHLCEYEQEITQLKKEISELRAERDAYKLSAMTLKKVYQKVLNNG